MKIKAGIVGAAGFAGAELTRLLLGHPSFELCAITSDALAGRALAEVYPAFAGASDLVFSKHDQNALADLDVAFLAVPHTASLAMTPDLIAAGTTVIDLSADYRLKDPAIYEKWYKVAHTSTDLLAKAAFGLPELTGDELASAAARRAAGEAVLVACAGCYPTATSLAAAPFLRAGLVEEGATVIVDALSGITGAGKKATERTHFCFANESVEAYGVGTHRHTPEISQILGLAPGKLVFTPHLVPMNRGLLSTVKLPLAKGPAAPDPEELAAIQQRFYAESPLVEAFPAGKLPKTASVAGTARAQVGVAYHAEARMIIAIGAIDNLGKGAAGQAVQCANIIFGLDQTEGLTSLAVGV